MPIPAAVIAAIISAVGGLGSAAMNANKPPQAQLPKGEFEPTGPPTSEAALAAGQRQTVADAFPTPQAQAPPPATGGGQIDPRIMMLLKQMGGL